jgi:hypothetical protein
MTDTETTSNELLFEEVPSTTRPGIYSTAVGNWLKQLREHPDQTVKFPEPVGAGVGTAIKKGLGYGAKEGEFDVATRKRDVNGTETEGGKVWLYATYVKGESGAE